jgi:hypothetical protein
VPDVPVMVWDRSCIHSIHSCPFSPGSRIATASADGLVRCSTRTPAHHSSACAWTSALRREGFFLLVRSSPGSSRSQASSLNILP